MKMLVRGAIALGMGAAVLWPAHPAVEAQTANPVALAGYQITQFIGPSTSYSHPDSVVSDGTHIFVGYQNVTAKDGSDNKTSTVVEYTVNGAVLNTFTVPGHNDGLRVDPATHLVWATSNEDGNPTLVTIDPASSTITPYTFPTPTPHGGGYDDLAFTGGAAFIAASNPTLNSAGNNPNPALDAITLSAGKVSLTPVLAGNAMATDISSQQSVTLNLTDPDSMTVDPAGDVVLDDQGDSQLVFLQHPGTAQQAVTRLSVGTQIDDFVWATAQSGTILIVDGPANMVWKLSGALAPGTVYVEAPSDSGVAGFVGTLDLKSGTISPIAIGFGSPTGMAYISSSVAIPLSASLRVPRAHTRLKTCCW